MPVWIGSESPKWQEADCCPVEVALLAAHPQETMTPDSLLCTEAQNLDHWFTSWLDLGKTEIHFLEKKKLK